LLVQAVHEETPTLLKEGIRLRAIGALDHLPAHVWERLERSIKETELCTGLTVVLALSYSGRWDILQAVHRYVEERTKGRTPEQVLDLSLFESYLSTADIPHPDLLIRTSGEERISNFMLWQLAYTELYFTPKFWPDFRKEDFLKALEEYERRERRFGEIK